MIVDSVKVEPPFCDGRSMLALFWVLYVCLMAGRKFTKRVNNNNDNNTAVSGTPREILEGGRCASGVAY